MEILNDIACKINSILLNSGLIKGNFQIWNWIQIHLKRNVVQIGIESNEFAYVNDVGNRKLFKKHKFKKTLFNPFTQKLVKQIPI
jgi:hypothetical protein